MPFVKDDPLIKLALRRWYQQARDLSKPSMAIKPSKSDWPAEPTLTIGNGWGQSRRDCFKGVQRVGVRVSGV